METNLTIKGIAEETSKGGKQYWKVQTDQGNMTVFEAGIADILKHKLDQIVGCDVATSEDGKFKNIRKISIIPFKDYKDLQDSKPAIAPPQTTQKTEDDFAKAREEKNKSIYCSYAKDLFVELMKTKQAEIGNAIVMDEAITLIKQAIKAF